MVKNYLVGLGFVGTKIVKNLVEVSGGKYERKVRTFSTERLYSERAVEDTEIQIIDMGVDDEKTRKTLDTLIKEYKFTTDDQIYPIRLAESYYQEQSIRLTANEYTNLRLYYTTFVQPLLKYLGPGKGAQRYRPLARYFITRRDPALMLKNNFIKDIEEDIINEGHHRDNIRLIYVLSAGGGFGSGSFIDINTLLVNLLKASNINYTSKIIMNIPAGLKIFKLDPEHLPVIDGEKGALASSAALLLELLYLHPMKRERKPYKDKLLEGVSAEIGVSMDDLVGVDEIVLTSFANIPGRSIEDIFELHDIELGRFLYPETREELGQIRENVAKNYNEYMAQISGTVTDFAKELLIPITVIGVTSIQVDPAKTREVIDSISKVLETIRSLNEQKLTLEDERKKLTDELENLNRKLADLKKFESEISKETIKYSDEVIRSSREISGLKDTIISRLLPPIGRIIDEISKLKMVGDYEKIENQAYNLSDKISIAFNTPELIAITSKINKLRENLEALTGRQLLNKDEVISLVKYIIALEDLIDALDLFERKLSEYMEKISKLKEDIKPTYLDKLFNKSKTRAYSMLNTIYETTTGKVQEYQRVIEDAKNTLKSAQNKHEEYEKDIKREIENVSKAIDDVRKKINRLNETLATVITQLHEKENEKTSLYQELSTCLLRDLQRYYGDILRQIDIQKFVETLSKRDLRDIGVARIIEVIREIDASVADNIVGAITQYMIGLKYFATVEPENVEHLEKILGIGSGILRVCLREDRYIVASPDNEVLAKEISAKLKLQHPPFIIKGAKTSFITYVKRRIVLPLQVKEIRECLRAFFDIVKRPLGDKVVAEYRGLAYLVLDRENEEFMNYLENVKKSLEEFEKRYESLLKGQGLQ